MIRITSISNLRNIGDYQAQFDEVWAIVRSLKNPIRGVQQVEALSPSMDLFFKYQRKSKAGEWNATTFKEMYLPQFVNEMKHSDEALAKLAYLFDADKAGKKICLLCFCSDESLCHRSIIAGFLQAAGCDVKLDTNNDYRKYYDLFVNA